MSFRGLLPLILDNKLYKIINIVEHVKKNGRVLIFVDLYHLIDYIHHFTLDQLHIHYDNEYLFLGFNESGFDESIYYDLHMSFQRSGIDIVWIVPDIKLQLKTSSNENNEDKRNRERMHNNEIIQLLENRQSLGKHRSIFHTLWFENCMSQLKKAKAEFIYLNERMNREDVMRIYLQRKAFAIFTKFKDYIMFQGCNVAFIDLFNQVFEELNVQQPFVEDYAKCTLVHQLDALHVPIVNCDLIMESLKVSHDQLIVTSILKGNRFTKDHCKRLCHLLEITANEEQDPFIRHVSAYVGRSTITTHNMVRQMNLRGYMRDHPELKDRIAECVRYLTLTSEPSDTEDNDELTIFFKDKLRNQELTRQLFRAHLGYYGEQVILEDIRPNIDSITIILGEIRSQIYPYILERSLHHVEESLNDHETIVNVVHNTLKTNEINGIPDGLAIFEKIWSHKETATLNYTDEYDTQMAFILYVLRYLYKITNEVNLGLTDREFKALFVTILYPIVSITQNPPRTIIERETFLRMRIVPSPRCLTAAQWLSHTCYTAYYLCAGALNLTDHFTFPYPVLNGSELIAFYETMNGDKARIEHVPREIITHLESLEQEILDRFHEEYDLVTRRDTI